MFYEVDRKMLLWKHSSETYAAAQAAASACETKVRNLTEFARQCTRKGDRVLALKYADQIQDLRNKLAELAHYEELAREACERAYREHEAVCYALHKSQLS